MSNILCPVSNYPLTAPPMGITFPSIKGCPFNPELWLSPPNLYLMVHERGKACRNPYVGFYNIPDQDRNVWIKEFRPYHRSEERIINGEDMAKCDYAQLVQLSMWRIFVFIAIQGDAPMDYVPQVNFDYRGAKIEQISIKRAYRHANKNITEI